MKLLKLLLIAALAALPLLAADEPKKRSIPKEDNERLLRLGEQIDAAQKIASLQLQLQIAGAVAERKALIEKTCKRADVDPAKLAECNIDHGDAKVWRKPVDPPAAAPAKPPAPGN